MLDESKPSDGSPSSERVWGVKLYVLRRCVDQCPMENVAIYCDGARVVVMLGSPRVTPSMADEKVHPAAPPPVPGARASAHGKGDRVPASGARPSENRGGDAPPVSSTVCTPHASGRLSSTPPPLPKMDFEPWSAPPAPPTGDLRTTAEYPFDDSVDEGTPVPTTLPSASLDPAALASPAHASALGTAAIDVVAPPAHLGGLPLQPLPFIETPMVPAVGDAAPISSKPPTSIAPNMPQIPKPVSSGARPPLAPGIVSTQAIPLTVPARRSSKVYFVVAFAFAIVSGGIATAVGLLVTDRGSSEAAPADVATPTVSTSEVAPPPAPSSGSSVAVAAPAEPPPAVDAPTNTSVPSVTAPASAPRPSATAKSVANAVPTSRAKPKSDRIED
ncbi:MAG: hypothetical protein IPK82_37570 [Polyangiaceae bacterium]|nr:hypothetical protein [Polyangiaceae bacterium]